MTSLLPLAIAIGVIALFAAGWSAGYSAAQHNAWAIFSDSPFRVQWELILTSIAGVYIGFRMYRMEQNKAQLERNKVHSANAATLIACIGLTRIVAHNIVSYKNLIKNIGQIIIAVEIALDEARRAVGVSAEKEEIRSINNLFAEILNMRGIALEIRDCPEAHSPDDYCTKMDKILKAMLMQIMNVRAVQFPDDTMLENDN